MIVKTADVTPRWGAVRCERCGAVVTGYFPVLDPKTRIVRRYCAACIDKEKE